MYRFLELLMFWARRQGDSHIYHERSSFSFRKQLKKVLSPNNLAFLALSGTMLFVILAEVLYVAVLLIVSLLSNGSQVIWEIPNQTDPVAVVQYVVKSLPVLLSATGKTFPLTWNAFLLWLLGLGVYAAAILVWAISVFRNIVVHDSPAKSVWVVVWGLLFAAIGLHFGSLLK